MRKIALILALSIIAQFGAVAQNKSGAVTLSDILLIRNGNEVDLSFTARISEKATRSNYSLSVIPVLTKNSNQQKFDPVIIRGKRARISSGKNATPDKNVIYARNGETIKYNASVPFASWMEGADLSIDGIMAGCCSESKIDMGVLAMNIRTPEPVKTTTIVTTSVPAVVTTAIPALSTGDQLAKEHKFISHISEADKLLNSNIKLNSMGRAVNSSDQGHLDNVIADNRENSLCIHFEQGSTSIGRYYKNNDETLHKLIYWIRMIEESSDSKVSKVVVVGFGSPEGSGAVNERIALKRAQAFKQFILDNSKINADDVSIFNGSVDWKELRKMVASSDMQEKNAILNIIDNSPVWDAKNNTGRLGQLMRLNGGNPYRYMYRNFFPELRSATYIKVYYDNY